MAVEAPGFDPMMRALGRVAGASAVLEWGLVDLHATLLASPRAHVAIAGEGFEAARKACLALAKHIGEPTNSKVRSVVTETAAVWQIRGSVVHGLWLAQAVGEELAAGTWLTMRMRATGLKVTAWTEDEMNELFGRIKRAVFALDQLDKELGENADPPPRPLAPV
jgi:hypothetical protein